MKTAISVPDELFELTTRWASTLGIGRSAFFARAAERYVEELAARSLTDEIDAALDAAGDTATAGTDEYARRRLADDADGW